MKKLTLVVSILAISGCMTPTGNYSITGYDADGKELMTNMKWTVSGRGIYTVRNAFCSAHPNATVIIKNSATGEELKSASPYKCPNTKVTNVAGDMPATHLLPDKSNQPASIPPSTNVAIDDSSETGTNGSSASRLRLFGQNGAGVILYRNSKCIKSSLGKEDERVSGGFSSAFSSFLGTASNTSIGMPATATTRHLSKKDGLLSKAYFREYEIAANQPITVVMGFQDVSSFYNANGIQYSRTSPSCKGAIQFVPQAGADYEASFSWNEGGCDLGISRIVQKDGGTLLKPVKIFKAYECNGN